MPHSRNSLLSATDKVLSLDRSTNKSTLEFLKDKSRSYGTLSFLETITRTYRGFLHGTRQAVSRRLRHAASNFYLHVLGLAALSCKSTLKMARGVARHALTLSLLTSLGPTQSSSLAKLAVGESKQAVIIVGWVIKKFRILSGSGLLACSCLQHSVSKVLLKFWESWEILERYQTLPIVMVRIF